MIATTTTLSGSITLDGTLVLDAPTGLPPGRVMVTVALAADHKQTEIGKFLEEMHTRRRASGLKNRTHEEIEAAIAEARESDIGVLEARPVPQ